MDIQFTGTYTPNEEGGISFHAKVDGEIVECRISDEALDDINPAGRFDGNELQFEKHRSQFENIAREKIMKGDIVNGRVEIRQSDVV